MQLLRIRTGNGDVSTSGIEPARLKRSKVANVSLNLSRSCNFWKCNFLYCYLSQEGNFFKVRTVKLHF